MPESEVVAEEVTPPEPEARTCFSCFNVLDDLNTHESTDVCIHCYGSQVVECSSCGNNGAVSTGHTSDWWVAFDVPVFTFCFYFDDIGDWLCNSCTWTCQDCDVDYSNEDDAIRCCSRSSYIQCYSYKPDFWNYFSLREDSRVFKNHSPIVGELYMGIELEMEKVTSEMMERFLDSSNEDFNSSPFFCYFKEDGSLGRYGVELVTMPSTREAFMKLFPWEPLLRMRNEGARSFYYSSCGFHIHVSRSAFTPSHMFKFIKFQVNNEKNCMSIGQRVHSSYASWNDDDNWSAKSDTANVVKKRNYGQNRYAAINFGNYDTIELRYFKGNLVEAAIRRNIEFVDAMFHYTKNLTFSAIALRGYEWWPFVSFVKENRETYSNLYNFLWNNHEMKEID